MATTTVRPNATTVDDSDWARTGGSTKHGVLADDSDSTYITSSSSSDSYIWFAFPSPSLPGGAVLVRYQPRIRIRRETSSEIVNVVGYVGAAPSSQSAPSSGDVIFTYMTTVTWSSLTTVTPGAGAYSASVPYVRIGDTGKYAVRVSELYLDAIYAAQPTLNVILPTGTISTAVPTIQWDGTFDGDGGPQTTFQVKLYDATTHGAFGSVDPDATTPYLASGSVSSSNSQWTVSQALGEDTYRAYVRVAQTVNGSLHWSAWDSIEFTVDVDSPGDPTFTATGENDEGRVLLELDDNAGAATTDHFQVQVDLDGAWTDLRTPEGGGLVTNTGGTVEAYDVDAGNGETRSYRARAVSDGTAFSDWVTDSASWSSNTTWLKHVSDPDLNIEVTIRSYPILRTAARNQAFQPLGRADAVVLSDSVRGLKTGEITFYIESGGRTALDAIDALLATNDPILIQCPPAWDEPDRWVTFGDHERSRVIDSGTKTARFDSLPWTEVAAPEADLENWPS